MSINTVDLLDFGAKADGSDDSSYINIALKSGAKRIVGNGLTYVVNSSIVIPAYTELNNIILQAGTPGMNVVLVNSGSKFDGKIIGTGTTGIVERGVYPSIDGASNVSIVGEISNLTYGLQAQELGSIYPSNWYLDLFIHDIVGVAGGYEGYGVLLSKAINFSGFLRFVNIERHALYLSAGSSNNSFHVTVDICRNQAIAIYSNSSQPACEYNIIRGSIKNLSNAPGINGGAIGVILAQKANYNDISVNIIGTGSPDVAYQVEGVGVLGGPAPKGNKIHDCTITGQFHGADVIRLIDDEDTEITNNLIAAFAQYTAIALRTTGTNGEILHGAYVTDNTIDCMGNAIVGIYDECDPIIPTVKLNNTVTGIP